MKELGLEITSGEMRGNDIVNTEVKEPGLLRADLLL